MMAATWRIALGLLFTITGFRHNQRSMESRAITRPLIKTISPLHRKLLHSAPVVEPSRIWGDKCLRSDIMVNQGATAPLPNGIPTYTVEIVNMGCDISGIHLGCGWFSSARLINPKVFRRLRYDDCLVNDGKPLRSGGTLSFQYANTFPYPLQVFSVVCL